MSVPDWYVLVLLSLASFRTWKLLADDTITDPLKRYVTGLPRDWVKGNQLPPNYRERLMDFIECPWCLGFWISLAWFGAWEAWSDTAIVAVPFAISALVPLLAKASSDE